MRGIDMTTVLSHANDTIPAHNAAEKMQKSGLAKKHKARVFEVISNNFGKTCAELGELTGLGHQETQWRVNDLKNDGLVEYDNRRKCSVKGTSMSLVWLTERGAMIMNVRHIKQAKRAVA
jgi:hypothetical protein